MATRTRVARWYVEQLSHELASGALSVQHILPDAEMSWFVFVVRLSDDHAASHRDAILTELREQGIGCSNYFAPIHLQKYMVDAYGYKRGDFPVCEALADRTIALPFHKLLTESDVATVCERLRRCL